MSCKSDNIIVNGLWIGSTLSLMELLTIHSFVNKGHLFHLWVYQDMDIQLPVGACYKDANKIIPNSQVFSYSNATRSGIGKGSVAGFSDIFRYKLLYEKGGWWSDMDVTCLQPLEIEEEYFFAGGVTLLLTGMLMKAPKGSKLMNVCYENVVESVDENNLEWYKPINILIDAVKDQDLCQYIKTDYINYDSYIYTDVMRHVDMTPYLNYKAIHWSNEQWRHRNLDKNSIITGSTYERLLKLNNVISKADIWAGSKKISTLKKIQLNIFKFLFNRPTLLGVFKSIKNRVSKRHDLWI